MSFILIFLLKIFNNYSPKAKWIFANIHEPEPNNCFSIFTQVIIEIPKQRNVQFYHNLPLFIRVHTTLLASMCRARPFSVHALLALWINNIFFDVDIVAENKSKCGLSWSVLLSTASKRHNSFPKHFFVLFMHVERRVSESFWNESLTRTSSSFA